jgi:SagB-type dehydrogenase family enzyme
METKRLSLAGRLVVSVSSVQYICSIQVADRPVFPVPNQLLLQTRIPMNARTLPAPRLEASLSLEAAIAKRRSKRAFRPEPLSLDKIGQLLWAAQGITGSDGRLRSAPSAMEAYPLELYVATAEGLSRYLPSDHSLEPRLGRDLRDDLRSAAHDQDSVTSAPAVFVFTAVYSRAVEKLGPGAEPYVHMDLGHAAQNLLLQAEALGLSGVPIAWLEPDRVRAVLELPAEQVPLYLVPVGRSGP